MTKQEEKEIGTHPVDAIRVIPMKIEVEGDVPEAVKGHVQDNLVKATSLSSICVDGGHRAEQAMGELARAGADLGISLALMKMGMKAEEAFLTVYNYRVDNGQKYGWHGDNHVEKTATIGVPPVESEVVEDHDRHHKDESISGCGHCNAAFHYATKYGLEPADVQELLNIIKSYQTNPETMANMHYVYLERDHAEEGIFVVNSLDVTILPWDENANKQFFVYDAARDTILLQDIAGTVMERLRELTPGAADEEVLFKIAKVVEEQTNATLGLLKSSQGKPIYSLEYNYGAVVIKNIGNAPTSV